MLYIIQGIYGPLYIHNEYNVMILYSGIVFKARKETTPNIKTRTMTFQLFHYMKKKKKNRSIGMI